MARGKKHMRFNSSPSQAKGQDLLETTISVPKIMPITISLTKIKILPLVKKQYLSVHHRRELYKPI